MNMQTKITHKESRFYICMGESENYRSVTRHNQIQDEILAGLTCDLLYKLMKGRNKQEQSD